MAENPYFVTLSNGNIAQAVIVVDENGNPTTSGMSAQPLPTSTAGLSAGYFFTQTATELGGTGTTKVVCVA